MNRLRRAGYGASLLEIIISLSIFSIALAGVFLLFRSSYQSFDFLQNRQSVQAQMLQIKGWLYADMALTHLRSVAVDRQARVTINDKDYRRDLVSCLILDDWSDGDNYEDTTNMPLWNRYVVYSTTSDDEGKLERIVLNKASEILPGGFLPFRPLSEMRYLNRSEVEKKHMLAENLLHFQCVVSDADQDIQFNVRLLRRSGARGTGVKRAAESFEGIFRISPRNTHPKLSGGARE